MLLFHLHMSKERKNDLWVLKKSKNKSTRRGRIERAPFTYVPFRLGNAIERERGRERRTLIQLHRAQVPVSRSRARRYMRLPHAPRSLHCASRAPTPSRAARAALPLSLSRPTPRAARAALPPTLAFVVASRPSGHVGVLLRAGMSSICCP